MSTNPFQRQDLPRGKHITRTLNAEGLVVEVEWGAGFRVSRRYVPRYTVAPFDHGFSCSAGKTLRTDNLAEAQEYARTAQPRGRETSFTGRNVYDISWRITDELTGEAVAY